ncbi:NAD(P)H-dependent oxidoreductase [Phaeocystidibacter luteus]|uniref:NAD(P)H-dependent oxidoreductase n=1 Tax=Phaeocystidibacter luteus TaxID=911197 RepID=A0A6N6RL17_9FLAO|nr:NAD(P)H-dependent oxidoreductase [Phaeocystidibacter luteus]KAB2810147.1 NAD(P)H-dependent oxidoreductase [Phaeocystidibacter luteus]
MKNVLIINGHPDSESYNFALSEAYREGALSAKSNVKMLNIRDLKFNPNLSFGYRKRTELEPDLLDAQKMLKWADHLVWVYPVWWGSYPAIMKGFLDRVLLPGFAFQKIEGSLFSKKLLKGKTARIISTLDQPGWFYRLMYKSPSHNAMKRLTLHYTGVRKVKVTTIGPLRLSKDSYRAKWLEKVRQLGKKNA